VPRVHVRPEVGLLVEVSLKPLGDGCYVWDEGGKEMARPQLKASIVCSHVHSNYRRKDRRTCRRNGRDRRACARDSG
jgi:hypothetical protein